MNPRPADRTAFLLTVVLLVAAFVFGGGGARYGLANLVVQLAAVGALAVHHGGALHFWRESPIALRLAIVVTLALPLIQIIPLPESLWIDLPRRDLAARSLAQAGGSGWLPISLDPLRTLLAFTALVTPLAVLCAGWTLPRERLIDLGWLVVGLGLATVLLGAVQLSGAPETGTFYGSPYTQQVLVGTFANRNSAGLFLTFAMSLVAVLPAPRPHPAIVPSKLAIFLLLLLGVVLTQSRTAIALALLPTMLGLAHLAGGMLRGRRTTSPPARAAMIGLGALALLGAGAGALIVAAPGRVSSALERFEAKDDPRRFIWDDATFAAESYWPLGAGGGTFDEVYQVDESLENLTIRRAGRAHNDYLEVAIESGAAGLALVALWLALAGWLTWRARSSPHRWAAWAGSTFALAVAIQSVTDYPLRNQTILALVGFALLLLIRLGTARKGVKS